MGFRYKRIIPVVYHPLVLSTCARFAVWSVTQRNSVPEPSQEPGEERTQPGSDSHERSLDVKLVWTYIVTFQYAIYSCFVSTGSARESHWECVRAGEWFPEAGTGGGPFLTWRRDQPGSAMSMPTGWVRFPPSSVPCPWNTSQCQVSPERVEMSPSLHHCMDCVTLLKDNTRNVLWVCVCVCVCVYMFWSWTLGCEDVWLFQRWVTVRIRLWLGIQLWWLRL